jgi:hypothetical protein
MSDGESSINKKKVFISYSQENPIISNKALYIARRLRQDGVDVIIDKWCLTYGSQLHSFMESCVSDKTIDAVIMLLDKSYREKADGRNGGVGVETTIISSEIYKKDKDRKFIPVVLEKDEHMNAYCPTYLSDFYYADLSNDDNMESEYKKLVMEIYDIPQYEKPPLGTPPLYVLKTSCLTSTILIKLDDIKRCDELKKNKIIFLIDSFTNEYEKALLNLRFKDEEITGSIVVEKIKLTEEFIDVYVSFISYLITTEIDLGKTISRFIERIYSSFADLTWNTYGDYKSDHFRFLIWEIILCSVAMLYHFSRYEDIKSIINNGYILKKDFRPDKIDNFTVFRPYLVSVDEKYKFEMKYNFFSCTAELMSKRYHGFISNDEIAFADVLLCQLAAVYFEKDRWFPLMYPYDRMSISEYGRFKSKSFCKNIMSLFNADDIEKLRQNLALASTKCEEIKFSTSIDHCNNVMNVMQDINEIGKYP